MKKNTKRYISVILLIVTVFSALVSCTVQPGYEGAPENMRPINEGDEGAILYVPINWSVETSTGVPTAYYSSRDRSMITLVTVDASDVGDMDPQQYWESYRTVFTAELKDFAISKESEEAKDYTTRLIAEQPSYIYDFTANITNISYKFRQAVLKHPESGDIYIITYTASAEVFDSHLDDLTKVYDNFRLVTESIPMADKTELLLPSTEGIEVPEGYTLISNDYVDYYLFVPSDWTPIVNTGMTAASAPGNGSVSVNAIAFETTIVSLDEYWTEYETNLYATFSQISFPDPESKFTDIKLDGYDGRCYTYSITHNSVTNTFSQYITIIGGYVYMLTFCAESAEFGNNTSVFNDIFSNFRFKN